MSLWLSRGMRVEILNDPGIVPLFQYGMKFGQLVVLIPSLTLG